MGLKLNRGQELLSPMNPPFFHLPSPDLLLPCHAAQGPPVPQSLRKDQAKSCNKKNTRLETEDKQRLFFLT